MLDAITGHPAGHGPVSLRRVPPCSDLDAAQPGAQCIDARPGLGHRFLVGRIHLAHRRHFAGLPESAVSGAAQAATAPDAAALFDGLVEQDAGSSSWPLHSLIGWAENIKGKVRPVCRKRR